LLQRLKYLDLEVTKTRADEMEWDEEEFQT